MGFLRWAALTVLCLLYGSSWLVTQAWPSGLPPPIPSFIHFAVMAFVGFSLSLKDPWRSDDVPTLQVAAPVGALVRIGIAGACFFAVPLVVAEFSDGAVAQATIVQLLCAVPVLTVLAASHLSLSDSVSPNPRSLLMSSVAGLLGALLLLGIYSPGSPRRWIFVVLLLASSLLMALSAVWLHGLLQQVKIARAIAAIGFASAVVMGIYGKTIGWPDMNSGLILHEILRGVAFDLPLTLLMVWLMREMSPARLSARFLLAPCIYAVEYLALTRSVPALQAVVGLLLMGAGGVVMLVRDEPEELPALRLQ